MTREITSTRYLSYPSQDGHWVYSKISRRLTHFLTRLECRFWANFRFEKKNLAPLQKNRTQTLYKLPTALEISRIKNEIFLIARSLGLSSPWYTAAEMGWIIIVQTFKISFSLRPMPMETRSPKVFLKKYCFQRTAEKFLVPPLWEKREELFDFFLFFFPTAAGGAICFSWLQIVNTLIKIGSCDDRRSIST